MNLKDWFNVSYAAAVLGFIALSFSPIVFCAKAVYDMFKTDLGFWTIVGSNLGSLILTMLGILVFIAVTMPQSGFFWYKLYQKAKQRKAADK
jgi:hypothetical protein